jgi:hypothetical protein
MLQPLLDIDSYKFVTNGKGAIFAVNIQKVNYDLYRDWNSDFILIDTSKVDTDTLKQINLSASDSDTKNISVISNLFLIKGKIKDTFPLTLYNTS